jgi:hypothetical protein
MHISISGNVLLNAFVRLLFMPLESVPILVHMLIYASCSIALSQNSNGNPGSFSIAIIFPSAVMIFDSVGPFWCDDASVVTSDLIADFHSQIDWICSGALSVLPAIILPPIADQLCLPCLHKYNSITLMLS